MNGLEEGRVERLRIFAPGKLSVYPGDNSSHEGISV